MANHNQTYILIGIVLYIVVQLGVGLAVSRFIATEDDYLLAGRRLGYLLGTFTIFATWFGAETCIGSAGRIYEKGLSGGTADPFGYSIGILFFGLIFAGVIWRLKITTLADFYRRRYGAKIEKIVVIMMVPTSIMWAGAQIKAFGAVLAAAATLTPVWSITIAAGVVIIYTASGGLLADAVTDLIQGLSLLIGLAAVLIALLVKVGGLGVAWKSIEPGRLNPFAGGTPLLEMMDNWAIPIVGSLVASELVSRVLATKSDKIAFRSCMLATGVYFTVGMIPAIIGLLGGALHPGVIEDSDHFLPTIASMHLPTGLYILFAGALVSAILSTVDSALLVASSLVTHNLVIPLMKAPTDRDKVRISRFGVVTAGVIAYVLALRAEGIIDLVLDASAFGTGGMFVVMLFGLFTPFGRAWAAGAALVGGTAVWAVLTGINKLLVAQAKAKAKADDIDLASIDLKQVFQIEGVYLYSLLAALIAYVAAAAIEHTFFSTANKERPEVASAAS